jgi:hypothetical protein
LILLAAALLAAAALPRLAAAQEAPPRFELTPYAAYRIGGEFEDAATADGFDVREGNADGLVFNIRTDSVNAQWELLYAHQRSELQTRPTFAGAPTLAIDADYLQFGGTYLFDGTRVRPFIALTAGLVRFEPGRSGIEAENYLSGSFGGGVHLRADRRIGVRLEGRVYGSLIDDDGDLFCVSGGLLSPVSGCALAVDGDAFIQWEARAGVVFRF